MEGYLDLRFGRDWKHRLEFVCRARRDERCFGLVLFGGLFWGDVSDGNRCDTLASLGHPTKAQTADSATLQSGCTMITDSWMSASFGNQAKAGYMTLLTTWTQLAWSLLRLVDGRTFDSVLALFWMRGHRRTSRSGDWTYRGC